MLQSTAPFKGTNHEWEKEAWLKDHKEKIKQAYIATMKRPLVI